MGLPPLQKRSRIKSTQIKFKKSLQKKHAILCNLKHSRKKHNKIKKNSVHDVSKSQSFNITTRHANALVSARWAQLITKSCQLQFILPTGCQLHSEVGCHTWWTLTTHPFTREHQPQIGGVNFDKFKRLLIGIFVAKRAPATHRACKIVFPVVGFLFRVSLFERWDRAKYF